MKLYPYSDQRYLDPYLDHKGQEIQGGGVMATIENETKGASPDYKGDGVAVWIKKDKNGKSYLSICVAGSINVCAFPYVPKVK